MIKQNIVGQFLITLIITSQISLAFPQAKSLKKNEFEKTNHSLIDKNIRKKFPDFTIKLSDSTTFSNKDFIDKIVFVNFWNDHCSPCLAEMDGLNLLYRELSKHSDFLMVSFSNDPDSVIKKSVIKNEIQFKVFKLSKETFSKLNFNKGIPANFILDKKGEIKYFKSGGYTDKNKATEFVMTVLYPKIIEMLK